MAITLTATIAALMMSCLFVVGGYQKLANPHYFHLVLRDYEVVPESWSGPLARLVPLLELGAGLVVPVSSMREAGLLVIAFLMLIYTAAMALNIYRGRADLDCGCAGPGQVQAVSGWLVVRNAALLAMILFSVFAPQSESLDFLGWSLALFGAVLASLIYHAINQLIANHNLLRRIA